MDRLLTIHDLAEYYSVSTQTIKRWVYAEEIPTPIKKGRNYYWTKEQVSI